MKWHPNEIWKTKKFILCKDLEVINEDDNKLQVLKVAFDEDEEKYIVCGVLKIDAKDDHHDNCLKPNSIEPPLKYHHAYLLCIQKKLNGLILLPQFVNQ